MPNPTSGYVTLYPKARGLPLAKDLGFDLPALRKAEEYFHRLTLYYLCNLNNPTAMLTASKDLEDRVSGAPGRHFFLIDEACGELMKESGFVAP